MDEKQELSLEKKTSLFFEKYAIWAFIIFFVLTISFRFVPLIILSSFFIFLSIILMYWKKHALTNVIPNVILSQDRVFAGNTITMSASVTNDKLLPLVWLEWEMNHDGGLELQSEYERRYAIRFLWLLSYQQVDWTIDVTAHRRGVYTVGKLIKLRSGDGFRFTETEKTFQLPQTLIVYPKFVPVIPLQFSYTGQAAISGKKGSLLEDPLLIKSIRAYQRGDEWRKINWKASARTGALQTSLYEQIAPKTIQMYIDAHSFAAEERKQTLEDVLSIIASIAVNLSNQGIQLIYEINGYNHLGQQIGVQSASNGITPFLDHLAQVKPYSLEFEGKFTKQPISAPTLYFCYALTKSSAKWLTMHKSKPISLFVAKNTTEVSPFAQQSVYSLLADEKGISSI